MQRRTTVRFQFNPTHAWCLDDLLTKQQHLWFHSQFLCVCDLPDVVEYARFAFHRNLEITVPSCWAQHSDATVLLYDSSKPNIS